MRLILTFLLSLFIVCQGVSQNTSPSKLTPVKKGIPTVQLKQVDIVSHKGIFNFWQRWRMQRLIYNVKKAYPYAKTAGRLLREYEVRLKAAKNDAERRKMMKLAEKELKLKYGSDLKKLTFTQGIILIKLLDRETGNTSYDLVVQLRGKFTAFFYQGFARLWGYNLKNRYDPKKKDKKIEKIIRMINKGKIK